MNNSRDLYNFAGDTAFDGDSGLPETYNPNKNPEAKLAIEALNQENYRGRDNMPAVAPNRHQHDAALLQNGRPIIIEYNNIYINSPRRRSSSPVESVEQSEPLPSEQDLHILSPHNARRENSNLPFRTEQIYPNCTPDIKYGAQAPSIYGDYNDFHRAQEQFCNPDYINRSSIPNYPRYIEHPNYPVQPKYSTFQSYPTVPSYTNYPAFSNGIDNYCPPPYIPMANGGKIDQITRAIKNIGPLAFAITELSTARRDFHRYPGTSGYCSNYYGCLNDDFANTVPVYPFRFPPSRY